MTQDEDKDKRSNGAQLEALVDEEKKEKPSLLGGILGGGTGGLFGGLKEKYSVNPTEDERNSLSEIQKYLKPHGLSGEDGVFNHGDTDALIESLMNDKEGLSDEIQQHLQGEGKIVQARLAKRAMKGGRGPFKRMIRNKINTDAERMLRQQIGQGFGDAGVDPKTAETPDVLQRTFTFKDLREFESHTKVLDGMKQRAAEKMGFEIGFPNGVSVDAMQHTLDGAFGVPPGGRILPSPVKE